MDWNPGPYRKPTEAIVLAGGFGTRLKSVVKEVPKPMAPINAFPFLEYLLSNLCSQGIKRTILSVGYLHEVITDYFGNDYKGMKIVYALEDTPLGTGGGVLNALRFATEEELFLLNGDTFFDVSLNELAMKRHQFSAPVSFSLKPMCDFDRYGSVQISGDKIEAFSEKVFLKEGLINGGVYCIRKRIFEEVGLSDRFSLEQDYFETYCSKHNFAFCIFDSYFIDIGIPEDYQKAQQELEQLISLK